MTRQQEIFFTAITFFGLAVMFAGAAYFLELSHRSQRRRKVWSLTTAVRRWWKHLNHLDRTIYVTAFIGWVLVCEGAFVGMYFWGWKMVDTFAVSFVLGGSWFLLSICLGICFAE